MLPSKGRFEASESTVGDDVGRPDTDTREQ